MKPNELMYGDLVFCEGQPTPSNVVVKMIAEDGVWFEGDEFEGATSYDRIFPIPITQEILEKNGFIEDEKSGFGKVYHLLVPTGFEKNSYTIQVTLYKEPICGVNVLFKCWGWIPPYNGGINDIHLCGIGFIHEMQHALRLCVIEKEIVL